eukprot:scaffold70952_cov35-Attheya_sp.AAC.1
MFLFKCFCAAKRYLMLQWRHHGDLEVCQVPDSRLMPERHKSNLNRLGIDSYGSRKGKTKMHTIIRTFFGDLLIICWIGSIEHLLLLAIHTYGTVTIDIPQLLAIALNMYPT